MKRYVTLSVELTDFETFTSFPGAEEFKAEFSSCMRDGTYFRFYNEKELLLAEKRLKQLKLDFRKYYGVELESDEDIMNYPAVVVNPLVEYDLVSVSGKKPELNFKKIGTKHYLKDFKTEYFIFSEKAKAVFDKFCADLKYKSFRNPANGKSYFIPLNVSVLVEPMEVLSAEKIEQSTGAEYSGTFYPVHSDGRIDISEKSLKQIQQENFCISSEFTFRNQRYRQAAANIFMSGKLALALKKEFCKKSTNDEFIYAYPLMISGKNSE